MHWINNHEHNQISQKNKEKEKANSEIQNIDNAREYKGLRRNLPG